jgi:hypothetical protein
MLVLNGEELCDLYSSAGVVIAVKCRILRWVGYAARIINARRGAV